MLDGQSIPAMLFRKNYDQDQDAGAAIDFLIESTVLKQNKDENVYVIDPSVRLAIRELVREL